MIWIFIIIIILFIAFKFTNDINKDKNDLQGISLEEKFEVVVNILNESAFNSEGKITKIDNKSFNLYKQGSNNIINFNYGTGTLTITWKYKYFQKEVVYKKDFYQTRNLSLFEQQKIAEQINNEMNNVIQNHQNEVIKGGM